MNNLKTSQNMISVLEKLNKTDADFIRRHIARLKREADLAKETIKNLQQSLANAKRRVVANSEGLTLNEFVKLSNGSSIFVPVMNLIKFDIKNDEDRDKSQMFVELINLITSISRTQPDKVTFSNFKRLKNEDGSLSRDFEVDSNGNKIKLPSKLDKLENLFFAFGLELKKV